MAFLRIGCYARNVAFEVLKVSMMLIAVSLLGYWLTWSLAIILNLEQAPENHSAYKQPPIG